MKGVLTQSLISGLSVGVLWLGLTAPALGQAPPPAGPVDDVQTTLGIILDRLDDLEAKIDNQTTDLRGVTQNWDKQLDSTNGEADGCNSDRFTCLFPDANGQATAVRDNETGLVWDRSPVPDPQSSWFDAIFHCAQREVGGRKGWTLPMREQLASLVDASNSNPALPTGHPFLDVQPAFYWSASTDANDPTDAWFVNVPNGDVNGRGKDSGFFPAWCVRGGQVFDGNTHDTRH